MTRVLLLGLVLLATACGTKGPGSLCATKVPPPPGCNMPCDSKPNAPNTCTPGYYCSADGKCDIQCTASGKECGEGYFCTADGTCKQGTSSCSGLQCNVTDCAGKRMSPTTLTGTVFAPNGTLPLFGVSVYVPNTDPGQFMPGVQCGACSKGLPGDPIVETLTDDHGNFVLTDVPNGPNIPLVITIGKWRRQIKVPNVDACQTQQVAAVDTALPKSQDDMTPNTRSVDMPLIAISTGSADSLECLVRRLGIADKEITTDAGAGRIHLYADLQSGQGLGVKAFDPGWAGGTANFNDSQTLWGSTDPGKLNKYDIVILSCEGRQAEGTKPQQAMDHLKAYADLGGRVFLSHWHNLWLEGNTQTGGGSHKPTVWPGIATFNDGANNTPDQDAQLIDTIDENSAHNPKGKAFADWMLNVGGSTVNNVPMRDSVPITKGTAKATATGFGPMSDAERWVYWQNGGTQQPQIFQFTTPNEAADDSRCGKVVFSDMHVSGSNPAGNYPTSCGNMNTLSAQEKALAFMFFDISSCVGKLF